MPFQQMIPDGLPVILSGSMPCSLRIDRSVALETDRIPGFQRSPGIWVFPLRGVLAVCRKIHQGFLEKVFDADLDSVGILDKI